MMKKLQSKLFMEMRQAYLDSIYRMMFMNSEMINLRKRLQQKLIGLFSEKMKLLKKELELDKLIRQFLMILK